MKDLDWNVFGHEWAARLLQGHIATGAIRHAYLFTGPDGVGRRTLALRFAQAINCLQPPQPGAYCGECRVCRQIAAMQHSDLAMVQSEPDSHNLKVEQIREMQHMMSMMPYEGKRRIAILLNFEEANPNAQNALLKTLEEAPERAMLILTADSAESLLPTIISRCETLRLRPMTLTTLTQVLEQRGLSPANARVFAHLSSGRLGAALALWENKDLQQERRDTIDGMFELLGEGVCERFEYANSITKDKDSLRDRLREMLRTWITIWRDLMLACVDPTLPLVNLDYAETITSLAQKLDLKTARDVVINLERAAERLDANANSRLLMEVLFMDWPKLFDAKGDIDD